jgi:uncharacterized protein
VSAHRRIILLSLCGIGLVTAVAFSILGTLQSNTVALRSGARRYTLQIATTPVQQHLGLGDRASLPRDEGMLFVFDRPGTQCFWMKDMHFPLDMIWLSGNKRIGYIKANISPATYPHVFCPSVPAQYVIELNAGQAAQAGMHTGEVLEF